MTTENLVKIQGSQPTKQGQGEQRWMLRFCEAVNSGVLIGENVLTFNGFWGRLSNSVVVSKASRVGVPSLDFRWVICATRRPRSLSEQFD